MVHLQRHHRATEESHDHHDQQAAHSDGVHLEGDIVGVVRTPDYVPEGPAGQQGKFLNR